MAIKRYPSVTTNEAEKKVTGLIYADTKEEVTDDLVFEDGYSMDMGSVAITGDWHVATMLSTGKWSWKENGGN